ncbi:MAG: response regulator, partial [Acutalibacteraceae bacterium]|nr:response regulator [Acutalibacteraceae bacterium]
MIAIAVDDEPLMLHALVKAIKASDDITTVTDFTSCEDALDFMKNNPADIAFLDINMRGMGGLSLAEKIIGFCPDCKIVFCTGYEEYAISAFKLHVSGYLMKPISAEDVQVEINNIKGVRQREKPLTAKCFGNFEVYVNGEKLVFKRSKTKELLAFLIDRHGAGVTIAQICVALWGNDQD